VSIFTSNVLEPFTTILLIGLAGITSFLTAALGAGGGLLLLVVMASIMPMAVVIPVHGLVQLGSNANRMLMTFRYIDMPMLIYFSIGGIIGAIGASFLVVELPLELMKIAVGLFVIYLLWGARPTLRETSKSWRVFVGIFTTFMSMFVGASGPLVGSFMQVNGYEKMRFTATFSSCMTFQHLLKAFVFGAIGFSFWQWLPLIIAMIVSGAIGTWLGLKQLKKTPTEKFRSVFRFILSLLCAQLIIQAIFQTIGAHSFPF
jgi:uncharacterized membrane protein YfcA|tara:strand:- start:220 stop:996 length:777 start_codon:yes stop_codon:yes gene_type:complete